MTRLWNRLREIVWLAVLALGLIVAAVVVAVLWSVTLGGVLALAGIGCAILARET